MSVNCMVCRFQELDLSKEALLLSTDSAREPEWRTACERAVNKIDLTVDYTLVSYFCRLHFVECYL